MHSDDERARGGRAYEITRAYRHIYSDIRSILHGRSSRASPKTRYRAINRAYFPKRAQRGKEAGKREDREVVHEILWANKGANKREEKRREVEDYNSTNVIHAGAQRRGPVLFPPSSPLPPPPPTFSSSFSTPSPTADFEFCSEAAALL